MSRARSLAWAAAILVALLAPIRPVIACTCVERPLSDHVATASTVFVGTVVSSGPEGATFEVSRIFKGDGPGRSPIANRLPGTDCAVRFVEGRRYVVFATPQNDALSTDVCAGTTNDLSVVSRLSVGTPPTARAAPRTIVKVVTSRTIPIAAAAAMIGLVAAAALIALRASRRPRPIA